jgi:ribosomal protein L19E
MTMSEHLRNPVQDYSGRFFRPYFILHQSLVLRISFVYTKARAKIDQRVFINIYKLSKNDDTQSMSRLDKAIYRAILL